ncbi:uncharacterized protein [Hyperolius riggenbachi]|uniref:uncharacterized protein n=1 Tax=Hyperolius riggenbachi TaxID=752182 RepID=UPI0035A2F042
MSADLQGLIAQLRAAALVRGEAWLRGVHAAMVAAERERQPDSTVSDHQLRTRRPRPAENRSPSPVPRVRRRTRSPQRVDPPGEASHVLHPGRNPESSNAEQPVYSRMSSAANPFSEAVRPASFQRPAWFIPDSSPCIAAADSTSSCVQRQLFNDSGGRLQSRPKVDARPIPSREGVNRSTERHGRGSEAIPHVAINRNALIEAQARYREPVRQDFLPPPQLHRHSLNRDFLPPPQLHRHSLNSSSLHVRLPAQAPDVPCLVWILGNLFVTSAAEQVSDQPHGRQLGFPRSEAVIRWLGINDLIWDSVQPTAVRYSCQERRPDVLVLHAGGGDLGAVHMKALMANIKFDMVRLRSLFPGVVIVWSEIVKRHSWRDVRSVKGIDRARIKINRDVSKFVKSRGWVVVRHRDLEDDSADLFEEDGVHLNDTGNDIWCEGIQEGIGKAIEVWRRSNARNP